MEVSFDNSRPIGNHRFNPSAFPLPIDKRQDTQKGYLIFFRLKADESTSTIDENQISLVEILR